MRMTSDMIIDLAGAAASEAMQAVIRKSNLAFNEDEKFKIMTLALTYIGAKQRALLTQLPPGIASEIDAVIATMAVKEAAKLAAVGQRSESL